MCSLPCDQKDNQFRLEDVSLQKPETQEEYGRISVESWNETFSSSQCSNLQPREIFAKIQHANETDKDKQKMNENDTSPKASF